MLFLIILLGAVESHGGNGTQASGRLVLTIHKAGVVKLRSPACQGLEGAPSGMDNTILGAVDHFHHVAPAFSHQYRLGTSNNRTLGVNDAKNTISTLFHLQHSALKNSIGHLTALPVNYPRIYPY